LLLSAVNLGIRGTGAFASDGKSLLKDSTQGAPFGYSTSGKKGEEVKRDLFQKICWFSILLRQARVTLKFSQLRAINF
jgi:hypothetical protein